MGNWERDERGIRRETSGESGERQEGNRARDERGIGREMRGKLGERRAGNRVEVENTQKMVKGAGGHKGNSGTKRRGRKRKKK